MRSVRLSRTVTTKVTAEEYEQVVSMAAGRNRNLSEHVRELLLAHVWPATSPEHVTLLGEILALRSIFLTVEFRQTTGGHIGEDEMREIIARADSDKDDRAEALIRAAQKRGIHNE